MSDTRETEDKVIHGAKAVTNLLLFRGGGGLNGFAKFTAWFMGGLVLLLWLAN